jgi:hypothetical protein
MNTRELIQDTTKRSLKKYYDLYTKIIQDKLDVVEEDIQNIKDTLDNLSSLTNDELNSIKNNE